MFRRNNVQEPASARAIKDVELYKREKMIEVDRMVADYRSSKLKEVETLALECAKQKGEYEHTFHSEKEKKGVELVKLDAQIESKKAIITNAEQTAKDNIELSKKLATSEGAVAGLKETVTELKKQLERGDDNFKVVVAKLSKMEINSLGLTVTAKSDGK
jgi:uncharacterized coiled-coil protein SlyX